MPGDIHRKPFDEGTITKLEIFERYLEAWLPVFIHSRQYNSVNICDFFAGSGCDSEGCPGSPLRILSTVKKYQDKLIEKGIRIRVILNDFDRRKAQERHEVEEIAHPYRFVFVRVRGLSSHLL